MIQVQGGRCSELRLTRTAGDEKREREAKRELAQHSDAPFWGDGGMLPVPGHAGYSSGVSALANAGGRGFTGQRSSSP